MNPRVEIKVPESKDYAFITIEYKPGSLTNEAIATILLNISEQMKKDIADQPENYCGAV